ncbi:MAG: deoB [Bacteroidetes bacterium]|nr:deoB [Bacteroidota bacterium]
MPSGCSYKKVVLIILDGVGIGELPDAGVYGDEGSSTLAHTAHAAGGLRLPHLSALGLGNIGPVEGVPPAVAPKASYGRMASLSKGKDSTTGHWELSGVVLRKEFPTYPGGFPPKVMEDFLRVTGCRGYLGNRTASGTVIIQQLGAEHMRTGFPIVYTSADSVFQIAVHEEVISLERLYEICLQTREKVCTGEHAVGRVIARPFVGEDGSFARTLNRRDFSLVPPEPTILDLLAEAGIPTTSIGKIDDLFAGRGISTIRHGKNNAEKIELLIRESSTLDRGLIIANLGDFDTLYGHRNDPLGFARALEEFDLQLPRILETLGRQDVLILTADHGNDPVTPSTDHSREYVPLLWYTLARETGVDLGTRATFADVGKTIADCFGLGNDLAGSTFLPRLA